MVVAKDKAKKRCFVVGPIGKPDGDERIHSDWLLEGIILPVFAEHFGEFSVQRADKISKAGMINTQIIEALLDSELVIADITTLNPNCFYEIGIRHMVQKPIIHMHLAGQSIPFDIAPFRSIEFARLWPKDLDRAKDDLKAFVDEVLDAEYTVDNPVTVARGKVEFAKTATPAEKAIQEEVAEIRSLVSSLRSDRNNWFHIGAKTPNLLYRDSDAGRLFAGPITFDIRLVALGSTSTRQLHSLAEQNLPKYFDSYELYRSTESDVGIRIADTPRNRDAARLLENEASSFEYPVHVVIVPVP